MSKRQVAVDVSSSEGSMGISYVLVLHAENVTACLTSFSSVPKHRTEEGKEMSQE